MSSNLIFQGISASIQIFGVPLCLGFWGESYYGEWLLLFTIPGYLSISDFGLGTSSAAEMSMMDQDHRRNEIPVLLKSVFWLIVIWGIIPFGLLLLSNYVWPWYEWLKLKSIRLDEFRATFPLLILYIYLSLFLTVPLNYYRVIKKYHVERYISAVYKLLEFFILFVLVISGYGIFAVTLGYFLLRFGYFGYIVFDLHRRSDQFRLWPITIQYKEVRKVVKPGISGLFYMLGGNLLNQGLSTVIGLNMGPQKLVMYNTIRMLVNVSKQMIGIINLSIYAEFSYAFGAKKDILLQKLFRTSMLVNVLISTVICTGLLVFGEVVIGWWTNNVVQVDKMFFMLYLVYAFLGSISTLIITLLSATNQYKHTGAVYLALITCVVGANAIFADTLSITFTAISLILFEIIMVAVSLNVISSILNSSWMNLFRHMSFREIKQSFKL